MARFRQYRLVGGLALGLAIVGARADEMVPKFCDCFNNWLSVNPFVWRSCGTMTWLALQNSYCPYQIWGFDPDCPSVYKCEVGSAGSEPFHPSCTVKAFERDMNGNCTAISVTFTATVTCFRAPENPDPNSGCESAQ